MPRNKSQAERRKYIRLDSVFPVQFRLLSFDGKTFLSDWLQGFTSNVGKGGLCLAANNLCPELAQRLKDRQARLSLAIQIPLNKDSVAAQATVAWMKDAPGEPNKYLIGASYELIDKAANARIMRYAWTKKLFVPITASVITVLVAAFALNSYINMKLVKGNKALVEQLVHIAQESSIAKQKVKQLNRQRQELELEIQQMQARIESVQEGRADKEGTGRIEELNAMVEKLNRERLALQDKLIAVQNKESVITQELLRLDRVKATLEKANVDKMYQWLKVHQNPRTGLVMSFEGDKDIDKWAFIYDQALAMQAYTNFSDLERARKMLTFFSKKAQRAGGLFFNAYYVNDGNPAEHTVHSGPNIWLGIAIAQYTYKTKDKSYLYLAEEIARRMIKMQDADPDAGIRGGPDADWYATEHNLDAYALFNMLSQLTSKKEYAASRDKAMNWLLKHTYDKTEVPIKRGKGDATIATDTYAWSIAAIGPKKLEELGMNPDRIIEFAEEHCVAKVCFRRPGAGVVNVRGFDFAPERHLARGGVVSSEWTSQMILAFRIMADFYYNKGMVAKARSYDLKADSYLAELGNMVISSPSPSGQGESCLPYASADFVDTGHGWYTPKGCFTGSVSGTVYTIFAYYRYNPLELAGWPEN